MGLSSATGARGEPLRAVPDLTGRKESFPEGCCYATCRIVSGGLAVRWNHKSLQTQFFLQS